jgi:hypothetical protein
MYRRPLYLVILANIHALLLFAATYPLIASIMEYSGTQFRRFGTAGVLILIPILLSLAFVHKIRHFSAFFLSGVLISALTGELAECWCGLHSAVGTVCKWWTVFFSMIVLLIRLGSKIRFGRMKRDFEDFHGKTSAFPLHEQDVSDVLTRPHPAHWAWFTVLYLAGMAGEFTTCLYVLFGIVFLDLFVCLGFCYGDALCGYVSENQKIAHLPVSAMRRIHRMTGIFAAALLLLFLLPSVLFGHEFRFNPSFEGPGISSEEAFGQQEDNGMLDFFDQLPEDESTPPPEWLTNLMEFFGFLLLAIFACSLIRALLQWLKKIGREFSTEDEDEVVFLMTEPTDSAAHATRRRWGTRLSARQQIRRRYRKVIRRATKGQPNRWATPSELEAQASLPDTEEVRSLHEAYEVARYGDENTNLRT